MSRRVIERPSGRRVRAGAGWVSVRIESYAYGEATMLASTFSAVAPVVTVTLSTVTSA